jgi:serine/threonine-protein kinase
MATVYLAKDLRHERDVAVKVFEPELAVALGSERFLREIKITAGLNHPHILPLLDSGEADSFLFYVMPFVDGESLRQMLDRDRELGADEAVRITEQVAGALSYAHSRGIVHRDLKPENILLQSGQVVVADFGIALALDSAGGARLTETGLSIGTPAYMSPEQVAGEKEIDARSDIYSLGCMLYEMLAGDPPFVASNPRAVLAKHLTDPAPPVTTVRPGVSPPVAATIAKALEKAPADRFETAESFATALLSEAVAEEADQEKSIVVLPFANLSPDPGAEYFSDGLTEEIITDLSAVSALRVISRGSAMQLKGTEKNPKQICRELGVQYVLEGGIRTAGNRLRITAQLTDGDAGKHLWAEKFDGTMEDVFGIQETVSRSIVDALKLSLSPEEDQQLSERPIEDVRAFEMYLAGRRDFWAGTPDGLERARMTFETGLETIGPNVVLLQGLAEVHLQEYEYGVKPGEETLQKAEELTDQIAVLEPNSAQNLYLRGRLVRLRGSTIGAIENYEKALAIDPNHSSCLVFLFHSLSFQGGQAEFAAPLKEKILAQNPLDFITWFCVGLHEWMRGRVEEGASAVRTGARFVGGNEFFADIFDAYAHAWLGRRKEALALVEPFQEKPVLPVYGEWAQFLERALKEEGSRAGEALSAETRGYLWNDPELAWFSTSTFALAGDKEEALNWLEHAVDFGWINHPLFAEQDPHLECIRGEERFKDLMVKVKRDWEALGARLEAMPRPSYF